MKIHKVHECGWNVRNGVAVAIAEIAEKEV